MVYFLREKIFPLAVFAHGEIPDLTSHLMAWHTCCVHRKYLSSWREETETAIEETCSSYFEEFHWGEEGRWGKNIPQKKKKKKNWLEQGPPWKNTDISCTETPLCTSKTQTLKKQSLSARYKRLHETGGTQRGGNGISGLFFFNIHQSSVKWTWMEFGRTDRIALSHTPPYGRMVRHPYLSCSASWPFCTSWTQRWWDRVLCPWVVSLQCAASGSPDPTYSHRFCFSWCRLPIRSTGPPRSPLQRHTETVMCSETTAVCRLEATQRPRVKL